MSDVNLAKGIDLRMMKKAENVVIGFEVSEGFINTERGTLSPDRGEGSLHVAVPGLEVTFIVANGERRKAFVFTLANIMPMMAVLSDWGLRHTTVSQEDVHEGDEELKGPQS